ncbi:MAG: hypothetical protein O3B73_19165, partial [bacterium]|nr:hypothetical protein [bacterium]
MTNEEFEEKVSAYIDEELSPIGRADMERKAAESEACRVLLKDVKALKDRLARLPQAQPSAGFNFALRSHLLIEIARDQRMSRRIRRVFFGSAMRSVASLAAAV